MSVSFSTHRRGKSEASKVQQLLENLTIQMPSGKISRSEYSRKIAEANQQFSTAYRGIEKIDPNSLAAKVRRRLNQALIATGQREKVINWDKQRPIKSTDEKKRSSTVERVDQTSKRPIAASNSERAFADELSRPTYALNGRKNEKRSYKIHSPLS